MLAHVAETLFIALAIAVMGKHLDHAALSSPPAGAIRDNAIQFDLQRTEHIEPPFNVSEPGACNRIHGLYD